MHLMMRNRRDHVEYGKFYIVSRVQKSFEHLLLEIRMVQNSEIAVLFFLILDLKSQLIVGEFVALSWLVWLG